MKLGTFSVLRRPIISISADKDPYKGLEELKEISEESEIENNNDEGS